MIENPSGQILPLEILDLIFQHARNEKFLLNKRFTEQYFKFRFSQKQIYYYDGADLKITSPGTMFPYHLYVTDISVAHNAKITQSMLEGLKIFKNCSKFDLHLSESFDLVLDHFPKVSELFCFSQNPHLTAVLIPRYTHLIKLGIHFLVPEMACFNKLPNLVELHILKGLHGERINYSNLPKLQNIKILTIHNHSQQDLNSFQRVFPCLLNLDFRNTEVNEFQHLQGLKYLTCTNDCTVPTSLQTLITHQDLCISLPFNLKDLQIYNAHLDPESFSFEECFLKCMGYCQNASGSTTIYLKGGVVVKNRKRAECEECDSLQIGNLHFYSKRKSDFWERNTSTILQDYTSNYFNK